MTCLKTEFNDWTVKNGRSNSSDLFLRLVKDVKETIKDSAFDLINGRAETVAGVIVARLAHGYGFSPRGGSFDAQDSENERSCFTCEQNKLCFVFNRVLTSLTGVTMINIDSEETPGQWGDIFKALGNACMEYKGKVNE